MRLRAALVFLLATIAHPSAVETVADQAQRAVAIFAGGLSLQSFLGAAYGVTLFDGIEGNWARLIGPDPKTGIETYGADTEKACRSGNSVALASQNPLTLSVTNNLPKAGFTQTYTLIAGSTFGEHTDALPYLAAIGLGPDKSGSGADQQRALALSLANGTLQIYRPSPDILVMARDRGYPLIFARCPAT